MKVMCLEIYLQRFINVMIKRQQNEIKKIEFIFLGK